MITQTDSCRKRSHNPSVSYSLSLPLLLIVTQHLILGSFSLCVMTTQTQRLGIHITSGKVRDGEPERHRYFDYSWLLSFPVYLVSSYPLCPPITVSLPVSPPPLLYFQHLICISERRVGVSVNWDDVVPMITWQPAAFKGTSQSSASVM